MRAAIYTFIFLILSALQLHAQKFSISGEVVQAGTGEKVPHALVSLKGTHIHTTADESGNFILHGLAPAKYVLSVSALGYEKNAFELVVRDKDLALQLQLKSLSDVMDSVVVEGKAKTFGIARLKDVEGTAIYAGKKSEVVILEDITANTATNNSRQVYAKIAGLNIWENDGAGIQLGIGGRGLNPNRVTNFNTRQNGYDMSADALGYPESYYSPPTEALDRIEIVRGAASLQYGTQFGGLVNFRLKKGPENKKIQSTSRETAGSWGFFNTFNSLGGTIGKVNYYTFYQRKSGNGWRPNSGFGVNTAYASAVYKGSARLSLTFQYTYMDYLAHQPGGLTDQEFSLDPHQSVRSRNWFKVNWNMAAVILDYKISNRVKLNSRLFGLMASRSALGILTYINRADPMTERDLWTDNYNNWGNETRLLFQYNVKRNPSVFLTGFRYYSGHTDRRQGLGNSGSGGSKHDFTFTDPAALQYSSYAFPNKNIAVFAENIFRLSPRFSVIPGIRFENIVTRANGFYTMANRDRAGNIVLSQRTDEHRINNRSFLIGGIGVSYLHNEMVQCYANISQNYRGINFNDMRVVNPNLTVDPNLHDEKGYSADAGIRGNLSSVFNYDLSFFMINYANRIGTIQITDTATLNIYRLRTNIAQSRNIGLESFAEIDVWRLIRGDSVKTKVSIFSNFTLLDARYINSKEAAIENKKVELVPNIIFKTGIRVKRNKWAATYQFSYTGAQFTDASNATYTSNAINGLVPAYTVMDLSAEYTISKIFTLSGSVNNLSDNRYFTRRADSYPGPGIIPADARSFFLTLQVKL